MGISQFVKDQYYDKGRRTIPIQIAKKLTNRIDVLNDRDSTYLDVIIKLTSEINNCREKLKELENQVRI